MLRQLLRVLAATAVAGTASPAYAVDTVGIVRIDTGYEGDWNRFAENTYALHETLVKGKDIRVEESTGGYFRLPDFYKEQRFYDKATGRLISMIQWETKRPDRMHAIQVYVYDARGRVARDFGALYRTEDHDSPMSTDINFHAYNGETHAFRQFTASNELFFEKCEGRYQGQPLGIMLGVDDLIAYEGEPDSPMTTPAYRHCFEGLPNGADGYLVPN